MFPQMAGGWPRLVSQPLPIGRSDWRALPSELYFSNLASIPAYGMGFFLPKAALPAPAFRRQGNTYNLSDEPFFLEEEAPVSSIVDNTCTQAISTGQKLASLFTPSYVLMVLDSAG